jgi:transposase-like protein
VYISQQKAMTKTERKKKQEEMYTLIRESLESGMSCQEFITTHKITPHIFYYWRKKYLDSRQESAGGFLPVSITPAKNTDRNHTRLPDGQIDFILPNGVRAAIRGNVTAAVLRILTGM